MVARIQSGCLNGAGSLESLSRSFGISERQIRRVVKDTTGATPIAIAQTTRLLLSKQLLTETSLPITEIAFASGFASLRRFNELFLSKYGMAPRRFRCEAGDGESANPEIALRLSYRPPLSWPALLAFLEPRCIPGVERVRESAYERTVELGAARGFVRVEDRRYQDDLIVRVSSSLAPVLLPMMGRLRDLFDLHARPDVIEECLRSDRWIGLDVKRRPGIRVPGAFDPFELAWRAILGQQVSVRGATTLAARFATQFGAPLDSPNPELSRLTPKAADVVKATTEEIAAIGIPRGRAETIRDMARLCHERPDVLSPGAPPDETRERLRAIRGVGPWTIEYIAMRALHYPDAFPAADLGLRKAAERCRIPNLNDASEHWRPWRAYGAMRLWSLPDEGKKP